jgi:hypothetical protein
MGTCFGKRTPKGNSVCPSAENGNPCKRNLRKKPEDMIRDLEEGKQFFFCSLYIDVELPTFTTFTAATRECYC